MPGDGRAGGRGAAALAGMRCPAAVATGAAPAPPGPDKGRPGRGSVTGPGGPREAGEMRGRREPRGARRGRVESLPGAVRCRLFRLAK